MSGSPRRAHALVSAWRTVTSFVRRFLWRSVRALVVAASAIGPAPPRPPPPGPHPTEQVESDRGSDEER